MRHIPAPILLSKGMQLIKAQSKDIKRLSMGLAFLAVAMLVLAILVVRPIQDIQDKDRRCTAAYGARWDWQHRLFENDKVTEIPDGRTVCINIDTKEEKPVP